MTGATLNSWRHWRYRVGQFFRGAGARVTPVEMMTAGQLLPPLGYALFTRLPADAQRHSLDVLQTLQAEGPVSTDLAAAALLHDAGKVAAGDAGAPITLFWRGPLVLLESFAPGLLQRLGNPDRRSGWRYRFFVHQYHPQIGAEWAADAGCSLTTCWLIAHHQQQRIDLRHPAAGDLQRLQRADGAQ
jgi:hypothetical protein